MVDSVIENQYEGQRDIKGPKRRVNGVDDVVVLNLTLAGIGVGAVVSPKQRRHGDARGYCPHCANHNSSSLGRPLPGVLDRICNRPVSIQRDDAKVKDRARATGHVYAQPYLAQEVSQSPPFHHDVCDTQGHDQNGDKQVCNSQRADQVVGRLVQLLRQADCRNDGRVQQHCQGCNYGQRHGNKHVFGDGFGSDSHVGFWSEVGVIHLFRPIQTVRCLLGPGSAKL